MTCLSPDFFSPFGFLTLVTCSLQPLATWFCFQMLGFLEQDLEKQCQRLSLCFLGAPGKSWLMGSKTRKMLRKLDK